MPWQSLDHNLAGTQVVHECQIWATKIYIGFGLIECSLSRIVELSN
jgi:hypothetical protein